MRLILTFPQFSADALGTKYLTAAAQRGLKLGVSEAAGMFEAEAKTLCPVDTGRLRDSIATTLVVDEPDQQIAKVAPDTPYARRIEYGFVGPDSLGRQYHQAAQPYMRPAFDVRKDDAAAAIKESIVTELDAAMNKNESRRLAR